MKRILAAVALLAAVACSQDPERRFTGILDDARQALRRGEFDTAQTLAERGAAAAPADSPWAWTFQLYRAEVLIERHRAAEVQAIVSAPLPSGPAFDTLRARQKYLSGVVLLNEN